MKKYFLLLIVVFLLSGCELFTGSSGSTNETGAVVNPNVEWLNLTPVADTYEFAVPPGGLDDFVNLGQMAATSEAVCIVLWSTATQAYAACRNLTDDGQWPATCTTDPLTALVDCPNVVGTASYYVLSMGPSRTLTGPEAELADEIRRKTYCSAPRMDASPSPCTIL